MELRHLRCFMKAAELGHFTRAARALHISQPTLSLQVQQLENEVGVALFERIGRRVRLTEAGQLFYERTQRAMQELEAAQHGIDELRGLVRGTLRIGVTYAFSARLLPRILATYAKRYPGVRMAVTEGTTNDVEQGLLAAQFDVGFAYVVKRQQGLTAQVLFQEDVVVGLPENHPLVKRRSLRLEDLIHDNWLLASQGFSTRRLIDAEAAQRGLRPNVLLESNDVDVLLASVRLGLGVTLVSRRTAEGAPNVRVVTLDEPNMSRTAALLWRESGYRSAAVLRFCELATQHI